MPGRQRSGEVVANFDPGALRRLRTARGMAITALAERVGVQRPHLSAYEAGRAAIGIDMLWDLAAALDVDPLALTSASPLAPTLADLRVRAGFSRVAVAHRLGLADRTWAAIETGRKGLHDRHVGHLARLLGVSADEIRGAYTRGLPNPAGIH